MKILHVITAIQKAAGTSVFCGEVCNGLVAAGHDVTIAVVDPARSDCYPIDPRIKLTSISELFSNFQTFKPSNFDLIHIHALWSPILHNVSNWVHKNNIPVVWSPHGMLTSWAMNNKKWKKRLAWWLYQRRDLARADLLHATAESEVEDIRRMGLDNKVVVAPLGVNVGGMRDERRGMRNGRTLLFVSRVQRKKGLLNLAKAWSILKLQNSNSKLQTSNWRVRIVGPDEDGHTQEVKAECERWGILDEWEFAGPKYGDDLACEYGSADLFILPTHSENFGSVVIESLAHGVPVICTKGAPWKELETHNCGWWIDIGIEPLAKALKEAMSLTENERREMGTRGREFVEEKYSWDTVVQTLVKGYEAILR